jgi:hypothetical protein
MIEKEFRSCRGAGVLECWSAGVLECWSAGVGAFRKISSEVKFSSFNLSMQTQLFSNSVTPELLQLLDFFRNGIAR